RRAGVVREGHAGDWPQAVEPDPDQLRPVERAERGLELHAVLPLDHREDRRGELERHGVVAEGTVVALQQLVRGHGGEGADLDRAHRSTQARDSRRTPPNSFITTKPNAKPPTCAQNAMPPPVIPKESQPLKS